MRADEGFAAQRVDPAAVRVHLERMVLSTPFRNSKRCPALLRYVVEQELNGASSELKERAIAVSSSRPGILPRFRMKSVPQRLKRGLPVSRSLFLTDDGAPVIRYGTGREQCVSPVEPALSMSKGTAENGPPRSAE
jgi:hypothetical protein